MTKRPARRRTRPARFVALALTALLLVLSGPAAFASWTGGDDAVGCPAASRTWYFAEGTTRAGFTEYICIMNPGAAVAITNFSYMLSDGQVYDRRYDLPAFSRTTINVRNEVPAESDVSIKADSSEPVVVERPMYFEYVGAWSGGTDVAGATAPRREWYFAEGCTRDGFDTYLCIANPGEADALTDITYCCGDGSTVERKGVSVKRKSRFTVAVHDDILGIGRSNGARGDVSIEVASTNGVEVVAERSVYFQYRPYVNGGTAVLGATAPSRAWYFAEGCTRSGFDTYLCLFNPGSKEARVRVTYMCGNGEQVVRDGIPVAARSRFTLAVHDDNLGAGRRDGPRGDLSIKVESINGVGVVAERPIYFSYGPFWAGGHDVVGANRAMPEWYFAEGCTRQGFDTYLCLANPGASEATLDLSFFCRDGRRVDRQGVKVPAGSRATVAVHDDVLGIGRHDDDGGDVSIKVSSTNGVGVVAERPMYFAPKWRTIDRNALAGNRGWGEVRSGNAGKNSVALTFDIESSGANAMRLMDILKSKEVHATFFMLGPIANQANLLERMADEGHEIASHGVSHSMYTKISYGQVVSELANVEAIVNQRTGFSTKPYFRFPGGDRNAGLINLVNSQGYLSVGWSVDPQDWSGNSVDYIISNVVSSSSNGSIILMHDRDKSVAALPAVIDGLRARGLNPVTLTETLSP